MTRAGARIEFGDIRLIRHLIAIAPLALCLWSTHAVAAAKQPPPELTAYVAAIRKADAIADPVQRCLAYPDPPGSTWAPEVVKARCTTLLAPRKMSLEDIDKVLAQPGGAAKLDADFAALLDAHYKDPSQRERIVTALRVFEDVEEGHAERTARAWLAASKDSPFARTALGNALAQRGWDARGGKLIKDTPEENLRRMSAFFVDAMKEFISALDANPRLIPACIGLMAIGRQSSNEVMTHATARCMKADPASFFVVEEIMNAAEPRWGGSEEAMRAVAAYAKARVPDNPLLALFEFEHAFYRIERLEGGDAETIAVLAPAALQVPNAGYLRSVGGAYLRKDDDWKAFSFLSQALRFSPHYAAESRFRAMVLEDLGEPAWARADAERAVDLDPKNGHALQLLGRLVRELDGPAAALPYFERAKEDSKTREYAFNNTCGVLIDSKRMAEAGRCVDELLAAYPENPEGWRQRLRVIGLDAPGTMEAMERFLALHDVKRWSHHAESADAARRFLAVKNGTGSKDDAFNVRVSRGMAMEQTEAGMAYMAQVGPGSTERMNQLFRACPTDKSQSTAQFAVAWDVLPDGTAANVEMQPGNAWTKCLAKEVAKWTLPPPPAVPTATGYPMSIVARLRERPGAK